MASSDGNSSDMENTCVVCFKNVDIYSVGICDHPVCYECSTRMRVLCKQNECPICRGNIPQVFFTRDVDQFAVVKPKVLRSNLHDVKYGIYFSQPSVQKAYYKLLELNCLICPPNERRWPYKSFSQLRDHVRRDHELFYCDLCIDNLKIFPFERKCYSRADLAQHRRKGDTDNTSHRGHPICEFCDIRYLDTDELFRHLRRDHLFCHFCDADGKHQYYPRYEDLRQHFMDEHYLCEEGDCRDEQFTSVFRTDIDLKAHVATIHSRHLSRAASKQARMLEVEFNFGPRRTEHGGQKSGKKYQNQSRSNGESNADRVYDNYNTEPGGSASSSARAQVYVNTLSESNFPTLGSTEITASNVGTSRATLTFTSKIKPNFNKSEDFPSLGGQSSIPSSKVNVFRPSSSNIPSSKINVFGPSSLNNLQRDTDNFPTLKESHKGASSTLKLTVNQDRPHSARPNVSIQVNHKSNGAVTTRISTAPKPVNPKSQDWFPALGSVSTTSQSVAQWVQPKAKKSNEPKSIKVAAAPNLPPSSLSEFPTLPKRSETKLKKTSSITMPVSNKWANLDAEKPRNGNNSKNSKNKKKNTENQVIDNKISETIEAENKNKSKKKKKSKTGDSNIESNVNSSTYFVDKESTNDNNINTNGIIKKTSTLSIGTLQKPSEAVNLDIDNFPSLENRLPPGISVKPPPGFNFINSNCNNLTFTNSSGQSYSILPGHEYAPPPNFSNRNTSLIQKFMSILNRKEVMNEFKNYSDLFRNGNYQADKYYEHCQSVLQDSFDNIFPELLVLLPNIEKQQELYKVFKTRVKSNNLEECATCGQIIYSNDLKQHLNTHYMENHFPTLNRDEKVANVWKK